MTKGQPSKMTIKRKNPTATGSRCEDASIKQHSRSANLSKRQDTCQGQRPVETGNSSSRNGSVLTPVEHKTYSNDPAQVRQWAASSATGFAPFEESALQQQYSASLATDSLMARTESQIPGSFPMSRSNVSPFSVPSSQVFDAGLRNDYNEMCIPNTGNPMDGLPPVLNLQQPSLNGDLNYSGSQYPEAAWSYPTPVADDMMYSNSAAMPNTFVDTWPQTACPSGPEMTHTGFPSASDPISWSPLSAVDPSVSSSLSQSSYIGPQPDTPLSQAFHDGTWSSDLQGNMDPDRGAFHGFTIGESQIPPPVDFNDRHPDGLSTVKPGRSMERAPLLSSMWVHEDVKQPYMDSTFPGTNYLRRPSEGEPTTAREHPHYQVGPGADGLYHCPFADKEECTHKPEKLKCNYDKHLDSHLKPYRCKIASCMELQFSSTACLLRHEREAHGMHGHGEKPHLCSFQDCDRSVPGNGFPRRWNLFDHMKRVHDYTGPASSSSSSSPTPSTASSFHGTNTSTLPVRKRRPSSPMIQIESPKRTKSSISSKPATGKATIKASKAPVASSSQGKRQSMQKMWHDQHTAIKARLEKLDPNDAPASEQIHADFTILQTIGMNIRLQEAGQVASA